ncbi:MAG: hypothetical protein J1E37_04140 [Prevotella sp.]|nr:hypothetical protein [Prevotella sp.]
MTATTAHTGKTKALFPHTCGNDASSQYRHTIPVPYGLNTATERLRTATTETAVTYNEKFTTKQTCMTATKIALQSTKEFIQKPQNTPNLFPHSGVQPSKTPLHTTLSLFHLFFQRDHKLQQ